MRKPLSDIEATRREAKRKGLDVCINFIIVGDDPKSKPEPVVRHLGNDPIRKLFNRGTITEAQFKAAERLYSDWYIGGMSPRVTKPFKPREIDEGQKVDFDSVTQIEAKDRYFEAYEYINHIKIEKIIEEVIINCKLITSVALVAIDRKNERQANAACIELLKVGLDFLIEYYEIKK